MTNDNTTRKKANAVFFAAVMVVSMVAVGFAAAPAAAAVNNAGSAGGLTVGVDSTSHTISGIDVDTTGDVNISVNELVDAGVNVSNVDDSSIGTTAGSASIGGATFDAASGNITVDVTGSGDFDVTVNDLDTSAASPTAGISYTVTDVSDSDSATTSFDLVGADDVTVLEPIDAVELNEDDTVDVTVDHSTTTSPGEVTVFVLGPNGETTTGTDSSPNSEVTTVTTSSFSSGLNVESGDELQIHAVASDTAGDLTASDTDFQVAQNVTVGAGNVNVDATSVDGDAYWVGQEVVVDTGLSAGSSVIIEEIDTRNNGGEPTSTSRARTVDVGTGGVIAIDTDRLRGEGDYVLKQGGGSYLAADGDFTNSLSQTSPDATAEFELLTQDLTAEFAEDEATNDEKIDVDVESLRGSFNLEVSGELSGDTLSESELENVFDDAGATGLGDGDDDTVLITGVEDGEAFTANFTDVDGGDYDFDFSVEDTTAEDSDSINVTELGDGELSLDQSVVTEQQGDIANITVQFNGDAETGNLVIGDEENVGYQANISLDSGGEDEVSVLFNTYAAGSTSNGTVVSLANPDDTDASFTFDNSTDQTDISDILSDGDYSLSVGTQSSFADTLDSPDSLGTLVIEQRSTMNQQIWTASDNTVSDIEDAVSNDDEDVFETLSTEIENDNVTQTGTVAEGDHVVHQIEATGLEGLIGSNGLVPSDSFENLADNGDGIVGGLGSGDDSLDLRVRQTTDSTTANQDPNNLAGDILNNATVLFNEETDNLYVIYDISADTDAAADEEYDARFRVQDDRLLNPRDEDRTDLADTELRDQYYQSVSATFDVAERTFEFDQDPFNVTNAAGQTITGTSNVAPGSDVTVNVRSQSGTSPSFVKTNEDVRINADGTWSTEFDFSGQSVGDEYDVSIRGSGLSENPSVEGTVVEQTQEPANFAVSELSPQDVTATVGDTLTVSATVENTGGQEATQTVEFRVGGDAVASQDVTLGAGNSTTVEFADIDTSGLDAGDYEHGVFTDDDEQTATLTLEAADTGDDGGDDTGGDDTGGDDTGSDNGTDDGGSTDGSTPGFGAVVALVALIAAALLATRRND
ncbi:beta strand repeat-containing protein [Halorubrum ezzemoulense]|uniref:PGF-CTERM sorting domain-containing protein n=1 Tax=Halorubrum ezzemoulense TaxID=337243 RepID=A0A256K469_HALEZ|nr:BGTF surface domain-containing protein [Halorubrum ezzemoulense]OYR75673.1 hypothetical protein DJ76_01900 [Halorubrum ezzemoulense]